LALLIDTSVFIALERTARTPASLLDTLGGEEVAVSAITASELLHGVHRADSAVRRGKREHFVETVLRSVPVLPFTLEIAKVHAQLWADLAKSGSLIGAHDILIAATALSHGMTLVTGNQRHFARIENLKLTVW
jgi:tRNA(fMet)-specific endonuclease VapC